MAWDGTARHGMACDGTARHGMAWLVSHVSLASLSPLAFIILSFFSDVKKNLLRIGLGFKVTKGKGEGKGEGWGEGKGEGQNEGQG